ncbi:MAG TPA: hypothetical protein VI758_08315 [Bacteroidota bacterium]
MNVYAEESDSSIIIFTIAPGDSFTALRGNIHMDRPGVVVVTKPVQRFNRGDSIYTLSYQGEGLYDAWYRGEWIGVDMFWSTDFDPDTEKFVFADPRWEEVDGVLVTRALMVWWVQIRHRSGREGWLRLVNTSNAGFSFDEEIHGLDMLGS